MATADERPYIHTLTLLRMEWISSIAACFWFRDEPKIEFQPGQFLQVELPHADPDNRGTRRFFTIASSPTEPYLAIITKSPAVHSTFKEAMIHMQPGDTMGVTAVRGNFVVTPEQGTQRAFLAAGIGITPFRSIVRHALDTNQSCSATLVYGEWTREEFLCTDVFGEAEARGDFKAEYTITGPDVPEDWTGLTGLVTHDMIRQAIPDFLDRFFFVCGPPTATKSMEEILADLGVPKERMIHDYFPGY